MSLREQEARWRRFAAWEDERLRAKPADLAAALAWMAEAWELARRLDPTWGSRESRAAHWHQLAAVQRALARVRFSR